jgi:hypothetical protein
MRLGILACAGLALALAGCDWSWNVTRGSGNVATETRDVSGFTGVQLAWVGDVDIRQGDSEGLTITAEDNLLPLITTVVENGKLVIAIKEGTRDNAVIPTRPVKFELSVRQLEEIELSGAGNISTEKLEGDELDLTLSGAGNVDLKGLALSGLDVSSSGAGNLNLAGEAPRQAVTLSGLGNHDAGDLRSADVSVTLSGAGNATVWAEETLDAEISGAGSIRYYGEPKVSQSVSGLGSVSSLGSK